MTTFEDAVGICRAVSIVSETFKAAELAAKGAVVAACANRHTLRAVAIPDDLRTKLSAVLTEPAASDGPTDTRFPRSGENARP